MRSISFINSNITMVILNTTRHDKEINNKIQIKAKKQTYRIEVY